MSSAAPHALQCCPASALRQLSPDDLAALDAYCRRALHDPEVEPAGEEEIAAVARYERVLHEAAVGVWKRERRRKYGRL